LACPELIGIAGKWDPEDLLPGLSDFDTRFMFSSRVGPADWPQISVAIGEVHKGVAIERPDWARILEHLPGLNYTFAELTDPAYYYPEFLQWTVYDGDPGAIRAFTSYTSNRAWAAADELFQLRRFSTYFGPYLRGIDPPVNLGPWENKYALHSRFMHYFAPAVQAAVSLIERRTERGKLASLRAARARLPNPEVIDMTLEAVDRHYEIPEWYSGERLAEIERLLETYLHDAYSAILPSLTVIDGCRGDSPRELKIRVAAVPRNFVSEFLESARFSRLMKGRLLFYAAEVPGFDSTWLIHNELNRIVRNFYDQPLRAFSRGFFRTESSPGEVLRRLSGSLLSESSCRDILRFADVAGRPVSAGQEKQRAREVAACMEAVQTMHETLATKLVCHQDVSV
jgi:hypothetical protein